MASIELTKSEAALVDKFRPHFNVLTKPAKASWKDICKATKFVAKKNLGTVSFPTLKGAEPDIVFSPVASPVISAMDKRTKISVVRAKTGVEAIPLAVDKTEKKLSNKNMAEKKSKKNKQSKSKSK